MKKVTRVFLVVFCISSLAPGFPVFAVGNNSESKPAVKVFSNPVLPGTTTSFIAVVAKFIPSVNMSDSGGFLNCVDPSDPNDMCFKQFPAHYGLELAKTSGEGICKVLGYRHLVPGSMLEVTAVLHEFSEDIENGIGMVQGFTVDNKGRVSASIQGVPVGKSSCTDERVSK